MNTRAAVTPVLNREAAIERFHAIAQAGDESFRVASVDPDLERQDAICIEHADRCLGPG
jgi:hypothetical protein